MAFNNAGIQIPPSDAADESAEVFDRVNAINLRGVWAPGTTKVSRLKENCDAVNVSLTPEELQELTFVADTEVLQADRYPAHMQRWIDR
jgi:NAD(P)-dependent dehydrogenase (short-subunit alcohol dehydrogenase family)